MNEWIFKKGILNGFFSIIANRNIAKVSVN